MDPLDYFSPGLYLVRICIFVWAPSRERLQAKAAILGFQDAKYAPSPPPPPLCIPTYGTLIIQVGTLRSERLVTWY